ARADPTAGTLPPAPPPPGGRCSPREESGLAPGGRRRQTTPSDRSERRSSHSLPARTLPQPKYRQDPYRQYILQDAIQIARSLELADFPARGRTCQALTGRVGCGGSRAPGGNRSEEHTSELQSRE